MKEKIQPQFGYGDNVLKSDFEIFHYINHEANNVPLHKHKFHELYFAISFNFSYQIENTVYNIAPGDILCLSAGFKHRPLFKSAKKKYERIVLRISKNLISELSTPSVDLSICFTSEAFAYQKMKKNDQNSIRIILSKLINLNNANFYGYELMYKALITELLVILNGNIVNNHISVFDKGAKQLQMIETINHYIDENISNQITVEYLSGLVLLSKFHFMRLFKEFTGLSAYQYILQKRLEFALELIKTNHNVSDICHLCGFGDYSSFFRSFKKQYDCSPREFLNQFKHTR